MRVAILGSRGIPARHGGFETFAEGLSSGLVAEGHTVTVFCEGPARGRPTHHGSVRLAYVESYLPGPLHTLGYDALSLLRASRDHDVVYMLGYGAAVFCFLPRLRGAETWINMDGLEWRRAKWGPIARVWLKAMEGLALRFADLVVFDSEAVRDEVLSRRSRRGDHAVIAYAAPLTSSRRDDVAGILARHELRAGAYHLVVCRLEPENHVLEIIRGFVSSGSRLPLAVVADHRASTEYARACRAAANERVRLLGTVYDRTELEALRVGCTVYVHGHSVGGTNPSLLEAMACGNPCAAHDNPFNREVLGDLGRYFSDEASLGKALAAGEQLDPAERESIARRMRARVSERYSWQRVTRQYVEQLSLTPRRRAPSDNDEVVACDSRAEPG